MSCRQYCHHLKEHNIIKFLWHFQGWHNNTSWQSCHVNQERYLMYAHGLWDLDWSVYNRVYKRLKKKPTLYCKFITWCLVKFVEWTMVPHQSIQYRMCRYPPDKQSADWPLKITCHCRNSQFVCCAFAHMYVNSSFKYSKQVYSLSTTKIWYTTRKNYI